MSLIDICAILFLFEQNELVANLVNEGCLIAFGFDMLIKLKDLGHVHESALQISDQADHSLLSVLCGPQGLVLIVQLLLGPLNMAALDELDTVLPLPELSEELLLLPLELFDSCLLGLLLLVKIVSSLNEGDETLEVLQRVLLLQQLRGIDLPETGDVNHLAEGVIEHLTLLGDEGLGNVKLGLPFLVVLKTLLQFTNVDLGVFGWEECKVLSLFLAF